MRTPKHIAQSLLRHARGKEEESAKDERTFEELNAAARTASRGSLGEAQDCPFTSQSQDRGLESNDVHPRNIYPTMYEGDGRERDHRRS